MRAQTGMIQSARRQELRAGSGGGGLCGFSRNIIFYLTHLHSFCAENRMNINLRKIESAYKRLYL